MYVLYVLYLLWRKFINFNGKWSFYKNMGWRSSDDSSSSSSAEGLAGISSPPYMLTFNLNCLYGGYLHTDTGKNNVIEYTM